MELCGRSRVKAINGNNFRCIISCVLRSNKIGNMQVTVAFCNAFHFKVRLIAFSCADKIEVKVVFCKDVKAYYMLL